MSAADEPTKKMRHHKWTPAEDKQLRELVGEGTEVNWKKIARMFPDRNERQCYERWNYYLSPHLNTSQWTHAEDMMLFQYVSLFGTQWMKISKFFNGRTSTSLKNRYLSIQRFNQKILTSNQNLNLSPRSIHPEIIFDIKNLIN